MDEKGSAYLPRECGNVAGFRQKLLDLVELACKAENLLDTEGIILWRVQVLHGRRLDGLALHCHYVFHEVNGDRLVRRQVVADVHGQ